VILDTYWPQWVVVWYLMVAVVVGVGGFLLRRRLVAGPADLDPTELTGVEVGYLTGGPRRAVAAVLAGLRVHGSITFSDGRATQAKPAPPTWGRLGPVVRIAAAGRAGVAGLLHHRSVVDALHPVRGTLIDQGWLLSDERRRTVRQISAPMWVLVGVGVLMIARAVVADRPFGWLVVTTFAVFYTALPLSTAPEVTTNASRALGRLTEANAHLHPAASPSLLTYGAAAAALAVGLYGTNVLLSLDPALALAAGMIRLKPEEETARETAGSAGSGCGGGGGCGSSSGSGGGSSGGSSCSSGSSCGGGCGGCGGE
jgi:uncharacterized protein (TIGR04222 family)